MLTNHLNSYNISIISGGARGIDSIAHNTCVYNNQATAVILGCGIDVVYPRENYDLFKTVEKNGVIISEFLPKTAPYKQNFPRRNRIISVLSKMVIVVEASLKSGALITANYAVSQNKDVMCIPGSIFSNLSSGCNKLIRDGADVFSDLEDLNVKLKLTKKKLKNNITYEERKILSIIEKEPTHIDKIVKNTSIDRQYIYKLLFEMQIKKYVLSLPGEYYAKIT